MFHSFIARYLSNHIVRASLLVTLFSLDLLIRTDDAIYDTEIHVPICRLSPASSRSHPALPSRPQDASAKLVQRLDGSARFERVGRRDCGGTSLDKAQPRKMGVPPVNLSYIHEERGGKQNPRIRNQEIHEASVKS